MNLNPKTNKVIGHALHLIREDLGLTREEVVAREMDGWARGVQTNLLNVENAYVSISAPKLLSLLARYNVTLAQFEKVLGVAKDDVEEQERTAAGRTQALRDALLPGRE